MPIATHNTPTTTSIEPIKVIRNILMAEMDLKDSQIKDAYQLYEIPTDGLFIEVGYLGPSEQIANQSYFDEATLNEVQQSVFRHTIRIEIMSLAPDNSARIRKEEISLALRSFYSINQQNLNNMGIAWLQDNFIDASETEGASMLNRYITNCYVNALHQKIKTSGYYDDFPLQLVVDQQGGGHEDIVNIPTGELPYAS